MALERVATKLFEPADFPEQDEHDRESSHGDPSEDKSEDGLDLSHTLSLVAPVKSKCIREIPNGGLQAWLQVLGSWVLFHDTWGVTNAFGVFQAFYTSSGYIQSSPSDISIIGAVQAFFLLGSGLITGPLFDRGYFYHLLAVGSFLTVFGMMMTSLCTEYWQVLLAQGLCVGFGSGCLFVPSVAIIPTYFTTKKIFATGLLATGGSIGGITYPIMFYYLQPIIGYPWAVRIIGFTMLATFSISIAVMRVRMRTTEKKRMFDWGAFKELPFTLFALGVAMAFAGVYVPFFYISDYALSTGSFSQLEAFYLLVILNALSTLGRVIPNFIADRVGPLNVLAPCLSISAVLVWCWIADHVKGGIIAFCVLYGFFSGACVSLPPMAIVALSPTLDVVGARIGQCTLLFGCGLLLGQPIAGTILSSTGQYLGTEIWSSAMITAAAGGVIFARIAKAGTSLTVKV